MSENTVEPTTAAGVKKKRNQAIRYVATGAEIPVSTSWVHSDYPTMAFADLGGQYYRMELIQSSM